jgi:hypothetical protein
MENFYFTFGQAHQTKQGKSLRNSWVRVVAETEEEATEFFMVCFMNTEMESETNWSMCYTEECFDESFYPDGEFALITNDATVSINTTDTHNPI